MTNAIRSSLTLTHRIVDYLLLLTALWLALSLLSPDTLTNFYQESLNNKSLVVFPLLALFIGWNFCLDSLSTYRSKRLASWKIEIKEIIIAVSLCSLVLAGIELIANLGFINRKIIIFFWINSFAALSIKQFALNFILTQFRLHGRNLRRVMIAGTGPRARQISELISKHPELGYIHLGFIDDRPENEVVGPLDKMADILAANVIDEMIVALPIKTFYEQIENIVQIAAEQGIIVRIPSDLFTFQEIRSASDHLDEMPILSLYTGPRLDWRFTMKRIIDLFVSASLLIVLSPLLAIIAIVIKLSDRGPIFFAQERIGFNKRPFKILKFRTMVVDAEAKMKELEHLNEAQGPVFKMRHDPRITKFGQFLRKTSLDELPQLINVIVGDISLVGPRPLPRRDFERFEAYWFNRRFSVKPGITCIWQVSGRSNTSFEKWIRQDLEYIDGWSLLLDLKILLKTIPAVLRGTGAM